MPGGGTTARQVVRRFTLGAGPLKRGSDRLQCVARVLLVLTLLAALPVALAVATVAFTSAHAEAAAQATERHRTTAVLTEEASTGREPADSASTLFHARVTWSGPSGELHDAVVRVPDAASTGSSITVWTDRNGRLTLRPMTAGDVSGQAAVSGIATFLAVITGATLLYQAFRSLLDRSRSRRWAADWAVIEPIWTGKGPPSRLG
jgi:hypothetical protein